MKLACDIEADGLDPTKIWCIVCRDLSKSKHTYKFVRPEHLEQFKGESNVYSLETFPSIVSKAEKLYFHSGIGYDFRVLKKLLGIKLGYPKGVDTLVLSRLLDPKRDGGHSIEAWGRFFGRHKPGHEDWSRFSKDMLYRCVSDVDILYYLVHYLAIKLKGTSKAAIELEHKIQAILEQQKINGHFLDLPKVEDYHLECQGKADQLEKDLQVTFPPIPKLVRQVNLK